jgi:AcrR family transcriptional regulator
MAATASRLTDQSRRLTAERGLHGFTIEELCDAVGISRRTFFNYFHSKEEVVIGVDEVDEVQRLAKDFMDRGSRGWPAVIDDIIDIAVEHARATGLGMSEHADLMAAVEREPKLLARFVELSREREEQLTQLAAAREGVPASDLRARASVQLIAAVLRTASDRIFDPNGDGDFAAALLDSLAAVRAVAASASSESSAS